MIVARARAPASRARGSSSGRASFSSSEGALEVPSPRRSRVVASSRDAIARARRRRRFARARSSLDDAASRRLFLKLAPLLLGEKRTLTVGAVGGSVTLGDVRRPDLAYPALFAAGLTEAFSLKKGGDGESAPPARDVSVVAALRFYRFQTVSRSKNDAF